MSVKRTKNMVKITVSCKRCATASLGVRIMRRKCQRDTWWRAYNCDIDRTSDARYSTVTYPLGSRQITKLQEIAERGGVIVIYRGRFKIIGKYYRYEPLNGGTKLIGGLLDKGFFEFDVSVGEDTSNWRNASRFKLKPEVSRQVIALKAGE